MRKSLLLTASLILALWAFQILRQASPEPDIAARDGLIVFILAASLFLANAHSPEPWNSTGDRRHWPVAGQLISAAGIAFGLVATLFGALALHVPPSVLPFAVPPLSLALVLWLAGLGLFALGAFWPDLTTRYPAPAARWDVDEAGRFVQRVLSIQRQPTVPWQPVSRRTLLAGLVAVFGLATLLRLWNLASLPPGCGDAECAAGLEALNWLKMPDAAQLLAGDAPPFTLLVAALFYLFGPSIQTLHLVGALVGIATVPAFYLAAQQATRPGTALPATLLLAASPWHLQLSRSPVPATLLVFLLALYFWATLRAMRTRDRRYWTVAGWLLGLAMATAGPWWWAVGLGALLGTGLRAGRNTYVLMFATLLAAMPFLVAGPAPAVPAIPDLDGLWRTSVALLAQLLQHGPLFPGENTTPLVAYWTAALAGLGFVYLVRYWRWPVAPLVLGWLLAWGAVVAGGMDAVGSGPATYLLPLLPALLLAAAVVVDRWLVAWGQAWTPLLSSSRTVGWTTAALLLVLGLQGIGHLRTLRDDPTLYGVQNGDKTALGAYLSAQAIADPPPARIFVPPALLAHPAVRLAAGTALERAAVNPLDPGRDVPFTGTPAGELLYIVPAEDESLLALLRQIYFGASTEEIRDPRFGYLLFTTFRVPLEVARGIQGLPGLYFSGDEPGTVRDALLTRQDGPLRFDWRDAAPLDLPFSVQWRGALWVPEYGSYTFQVNAGAGLFSMQLDNVLVLDTSMGLDEHTRSLAQGLYQMEMHYRSRGQPGDLAVRWQRPDGEWEILPRTVLYGLALPRAGLLGTYFACENWNGEILSQRRDLVLQPAGDLPQPYSVLWTGKLAAPVAGEYRLGVAGNGSAQLQVAGQTVVDGQAGERNSGNDSLSMGTILLGQGWHDVELRYRPASLPPQVRLLWQPPGGRLDQVAPTFLAPLGPDATTEDLALPALPAVPLPRPAPGSEPAPQTAPATSRELPLLPLTRQWQAGNLCGSGRTEFQQPRGVAIDAQRGRVYVADTGNRRVVALGLGDGAVQDVHDSDAFAEPYDVAVDPRGDLFVLDAVAQQIFRIAPAGGIPQPLGLDTGFYRPRGFGIGENGYLYVADTGGARVVILDSSGQVVAQSGGPDTPLGQGQPVDVLALPGAVWATTAEDGRLWRLDTGGSQVATAPTNTFDGPHLAGLPDGNFFVTDPEHRLVLHFDASGLVQDLFGGPAIFERPVGIGAGRVGDRIYVAVGDSGACQVSLWSGAPLSPAP